MTIFIKDGTNVKIVRGIYGRLGQCYRGEIYLHEGVVLRVHSS